ncbi:sugar transferase [Jannaschia sp. M317]|uniref:sugar transferase n=1 Tax=Jannaschia sp. M317 TaxID=2867011 RepID=UPI0021A6732F|nr:sugar transferase [Jannaschia sp. M317]UWQ19950.1 sugar transferase [Jannaschia sp. M317]
MYSDSFSTVAERDHAKPEAAQPRGASVSAQISDFGKVWFDRAFVAAALLMLLPLFLVVSALILIADGRPIFFGHMRTGRNGRQFKCWKFRTMVRDAEARLQDVLDSDPERRAEWLESHKLAQDPRILPFGGLLRKLSIDELPQLWNVLMGEMSLVGPRPVTKDELIRYGKGASAYKKVRPGITGQWQVSGRSSVGFEERVAMDVDYVEKQSFLGDLKIVAKTPKAVIKRDGAC